MINQLSVKELSFWLKICLLIKSQDGKKQRSKMKEAQKQKLKYQKKLRISISRSSKLEIKETLEMIEEENTMIEMMAKIETIKRIKENHNKCNMLPRKLIQIKKIKLINLKLFKKTKKTKTKTMTSQRNKEEKIKKLFQLKMKTWHLNWNRILIIMF